MNLGNFSGIVALGTLIGFGLTLMDTAMPQNVATWLGWGVLNTMMFLGSRKADSTSAWKLSLGCTIGVWFVALVVLFGGSWHIGIVEIACLVGAAISAIVWKFAGPRYAIIALLVAMNVAGMPTLVDAIQNPDPRSWWLWAGFTISCALSFFAQNKWTIEDRLYPGVQFFFNLLMFLLVIR